MPEESPTLLILLVSILLEGYTHVYIVGRIHVPILYKDG